MEKVSEKYSQPPHDLGGASALNSKRDQAKTREEHNRTAAMIALDRCYDCWRDYSSSLEPKTIEKLMNLHEATLKFKQVMEAPLYYTSDDKRPIYCLQLSSAVSEVTNAVLANRTDESLHSETQVALMDEILEAIIFIFNRMVDSNLEGATRVAKSLEEHGVIPALRSLVSYPNPGISLQALNCLLVQGWTHHRNDTTLVNEIEHQFVETVRVVIFNSLSSQTTQALEITTNTLNSRKHCPHLFSALGELVETFLLQERSKQSQVTTQWALNALDAFYSKRFCCFIKGGNGRDKVLGKVGGAPFDAMLKCLMGIMEDQTHLAMCLELMWRISNLDEESCLLLWKREIIPSLNSHLKNEEILSEENAMITVSHVLFELSIWRAVELIVTEAMMEIFKSLARFYIQNRETREFPCSFPYTLCVALSYEEIRSLMLEKLPVVSWMTIFAVEDFNGEAGDTMPSVLKRIHNMVNEVGIGNLLSNALAFKMETSSNLAKDEEFSLNFLHSSRFIYRPPTTDDHSLVFKYPYSDSDEVNSEFGDDDEIDSEDEEPCRGVRKILFDCVVASGLPLARAADQIRALKRRQEYFDPLQSVTWLAVAFTLRRHLIPIDVLRLLFNDFLKCPPPSDPF